MDYTDLATVKGALGSSLESDDSIIRRVITAASRAIDHRCSGAGLPGSENYFYQDDVDDQELRAVIDKYGHLKCYPHKYGINSVASLSYRTTPLSGWNTIDSSYIEIDGPAVTAWIDLSDYRGSPVRAKISYNGGLATSVDDLPADLVEAATILAVRYYREAKTGLTDAIGVAELGALTYTKAMPVRVLEMLKPYIRMVPWT